VKMTGRRQGSGCVIFDSRTTTLGELNRERSITSRFEKERKLQQKGAGIWHVRMAKPNAIVPEGGLEKSRKDPEHEKSRK